MRCRHFGICLVLLVTVLCAPVRAQQLSDDTTVRVRLVTRDPGVLKQSLEVSGFDVLWADAAHSAIDLIVTVGEWRELQRDGWQGRIVDRGRPLRGENGTIDRVATAAADTPVRATAAAALPLD